MTQRAPELTTAGVCGLLCEACSLYIASTEAPARLEAFVKRTGKTIEEATCRGCRSDALSWHCRNCNLKRCAGEHGVSFCADCSEFPCNEFKEFAAGHMPDPLIAGNKPHRFELMDSCRMIHEQGWEAWVKQEREQYTCSSCQTLNSAYDLRCRSCGKDPGSRFVERHGEAIRKHLLGGR